MKRHECCANCGFSYGVLGGGWKSTWYCGINNEKIESLYEMGGREKCPCYVTNAEYKKANAKRERERKKRAIENFVYPQRSETEKE